MPQPRFPLYIPSKGRHETRHTVKALEEMRVPFHVVVEHQELERYASVIDRAKLLVLDPEYQRRYETLDPEGDADGLPVGSGAARNFIWDHSASRGHPWHWIMDDNISGFIRLNRNFKHRCGDGTPFWAMEEFTLRYRNVAMAGPNYAMFVPRKVTKPPLTFNTRIYSCNLIRNDVPYRWRCRYNEDTDLSLRMLKDGWCTVLFNGFLQEKKATQKVKGGNTETLYAKGTLNKSRCLARLHPDVAQVKWKFSRWHHEVDYKPFAKNRPVLRPGVVVPRGVNEFGLHVVDRSVRLGQGLGGDLGE